MILLPCAMTSMQQPAMLTHAPSLHSLYKLQENRSFLLLLLCPWPCLLGTLLLPIPYNVLISWITSSVLSHPLACATAPKVVTDGFAQKHYFHSPFLWHPNLCSTCLASCARNMLNFAYPKHTQTCYSTLMVCMYHAWNHWVMGVFLYVNEMTSEWDF